MWCDMVGCVIFKSSSNTQAHFSPFWSNFNIRMRFSSDKALNIPAVLFSSVCNDFTSHRHPSILYATHRCLSMGSAKISRIFFTGIVTERYFPLPPFIKRKSTPHLQFPLSYSKYYSYTLPIQTGYLLLALLLRFHILPFALIAYKTFLLPAYLSPQDKR